MNQIKAGAALNYVIIGLNTIVGLAYTPYMLRCLGQNEYGLYSLVASFIAYLTILDFGFGNAIVRYTAKFRSEGRQKDQWEMFGMFVIVYSIIGMIALCGGLALYFNVDALFDRTMTTEELNEARTMMMLLTFNLALTFPLSIFGSIISAYENFVFQRIVNILRIILSTGVMILVLAIGFKAVALVIVQTVFNILTLLLNLFYCLTVLKIKIEFSTFKWTFIREIAIYSFWIFLNAIMDRIYWGTGQFVLGSISGTAAVAIFSVAILLQQMYMQFSTAIVSVLLPKLTAMVALNRSDKEISDIFIRTGRMQCFIMSLILAGFLLFGNSFIKIWAGEGYEESFYITLIFFVSLFIPLIQNTGIGILQARNQMRFRSILYLIISILSLVFQILLAKRLGALGCAIAIGGALIIGQGIVMNFYYHCKQHIDIRKFWVEIIRMIFFPTIFTAAYYIVTRQINFTDYVNLSFGIAVYTLLFLMIGWKLSLNKSERELIINPVHKLVRR